MNIVTHPNQTTFILPFSPTENKIIEVTHSCGSYFVVSFLINTTDQTITPIGTDIDDLVMFVNHTKSLLNSNERNVA